eukprot:3858823-Amphidinium_carterae.1
MQISFRSWLARLAHKSRIVQTRDTDTVWHRDATKVGCVSALSLKHLPCSEAMQATTHDAAWQAERFQALTRETAQIVCQNLKCLSQTVPANNAS